MSIGGLFLAGVLPGVLIGISLMITVYIYAKKRSYPVYPRTRLREFVGVCLQAVLPILTPGIIVGGIVGGLFTPTEASVVAVLYAMLLGGIIYRSISFKELRHTLYDSARFAAIALFCIGTASAFGWLLAYFHIPQLVVNAVAGVGGGITGVGFITAAAFLFIGCFIDAIPAIIIVGTAARPIGRHASDPLRHHRRDVDRLRAGHTTVWAVPDDRLLDRRHQDQGCRSGYGDPVHPDAAGAPDRDIVS